MDPNVVDHDADDNGCCRCACCAGCGSRCEHCPQYTRDRCWYDEPSVCWRYTTVVGLVIMVLGMVLIVFSGVTSAKTDVPMGGWGPLIAGIFMLLGGFFLGIRGLARLCCHCSGANVGLRKSRDSVAGKASPGLEFVDAASLDPNSIPKHIMDEVRAQFEADRRREDERAAALMGMPVSALNSSSASAAGSGGRRASANNIDAGGARRASANFDNGGRRGSANGGRRGSANNVDAGAAAAAAGGRRGSANGGTAGAPPAAPSARRDSATSGGARRGSANGGQMAVVVVTQPVPAAASPASPRVVVVHRG